MDTYVVLGAGVIGLSTALELSERFPNDRIIIISKYMPGDRHKTYTSPCAGAHWMSSATDNGVEEERDAVTYKRLASLHKSEGACTGIYPIDQRAFWNTSKDEAGILTPATGEIWYVSLVPAGLRYLDDADLPPGASFGYDFSTFIIDTQIYLSWLQITALRKGISIRRGHVESLDQLFEFYPGAKAYFNCTGLGSLKLGGVEDKQLYPTRGQVLLVQQPRVPITRLYNIAIPGTTQENVYIFPRGKDGGIILGGCFEKNNWDGDVDLELAERIKARCCALCPDLGRPEELKVLGVNVGLRPTRHGGPRLERQIVKDQTVIHAYGFGGVGYQASWGSAKEAVDLVSKVTRPFL